MSALSYHRRAMAGSAMSIAASQLGEAISFSGGRKWKHPWFTTPAWNPAAQRWTATVKPGFLGPQTPIFRATIQTQASVGNPWEINPLTGKQFFSDSVFANPVQAATTETVDLPLYLNPAIPLDFHGLGFDGDPASSVPQYFLDRGVAAAPRQPSESDLLSGDAQPVDTPPPQNLRLLRACDIWLHQPREALTSTVSLEPGPATGISNVTQTLSVRSPAASDALRVFQGAFTPFTPETGGIDPINFDYEEPNFDEILISTVYLLSPPNAAIGSDPDASWTPYVRHNLFWNLEWTQPPFRQLDSDPGIPFIPPLAGGAAQLVINFLTASLNDATQQALNILTAHSMAGSFWTPGFGSVAFTALSDAQLSLKLGPDRAKNAAAKLAAQQAAKRATQLDPDFPYVGKIIPVSLLADAA